MQSKSHGDLTIRVQQIVVILSEFGPILLKGGLQWFAGTGIACARIRISGCFIRCDGNSSTLGWKREASASKALFNCQSPTALHRFLVVPVRGCCISLKNKAVAKKTLTARIDALRNRLVRFRQ